MADDLQNLRETIEKEKELAKMRESFVERKLTYGGSMEDQDRQFEARLRQHFDNMSDLVESRIYDEIQNIRETILDAYKVPITAETREYLAYSMARDVLGQLFYEIESRAKKGTPQKAEVNEEVIEINA